ncbi:hypothetical protein CEXT_679421 [Caerostris extrusa]|uniref:Cytochrome P450 n=1 Tax=Caerostris extrusa TaxID=172846 RepID=A0AAV4SJV0_CAEEX|nr:hypothetical protein CEXT_679421 [Caerostris extrusa]
MRQTQTFFWDAYKYIKIFPSTPPSPKRRLMKHARSDFMQMTLLYPPRPFRAPHFIFFAGGRGYCLGGTVRYTQIIASSLYSLPNSNGKEGFELE